MSSISSLVATSTLPRHPSASPMLSTHAWLYSDRVVELTELLLATDRDALTAANEIGRERYRIAIRRLIEDLAQARSDLDAACLALRLAGQQSTSDAILDRTFDARKEVTR